MVALYFAIFPDEIKRFDEFIEKYEKEQEEKSARLDKRIKELEKMVEKWSKKEMINFIVNTILEDENEFADEEEEYLY